jgi:phosphotriesterase-related protein
MSEESHAPQVMTVRGSVDAALLGVTDAHEHLFLRSAAMPGEELEEVGPAVAEVAEAQSGGLQAFVELTPIGLGRRPDLMREVSVSTGAPIIAATGYHRDAHYRSGSWVLEAPDEVLLHRMVADLRDGMHPTNWDGPDSELDSARAGVIKCGASYQHMSANERRRLEAAAEAARTCGVAVVTHSEVGTCGDEIADVLIGGGLAPDQVVLAHMDRNADAEWHAELLARGIYFVYDTPGRIKYQADSVLLKLIEDVVAAGFGGQIMLGLDLGRREYWRTHGGGPGLRYLMDRFVPRLEKRIGAEAVRRMLVDNPARVYALRPIA